MHGVYEHEAIFDAAFVDTSLHVAGDVDEGPPGGDFEPEFFAVAFHWLLHLFAGGEKTPIYYKNETIRAIVGESHRGMNLLLIQIRPSNGHMSKLHDLKVLVINNRENGYRAKIDGAYRHNKAGCVKLEKFQTPKLKYA